VTSAATTYCSVSGRSRRTPRARPAATRAPFIQSMAARCRGGMKGGRRFACVRTACRPDRRGDGVKLTASQEVVFRAIRTLTQANGYPPSVREIGEAVGMRSPATVHAHIESLKRKAC